MEKRHTLTIGKHGELAVQHLERVKKEGSPPGWVSHTFNYKCDLGDVITEVEAYDHWSDDTGGNAEVVSGGVGQREVTVKVTSQWCRGFDFTFCVYTEPEYTSNAREVLQRKV